MRLFLFLLVACLIASVQASNPPVSLILKSGKTITGTLVGDDLKTIQLRDSLGVVISVPRVSIERVVRDCAPEPRQKELPRAAAPDRSLTEIAAAAKQSRTGKARVVTLQDLERTPEVSVIGDSSDAPAPVGDRSTRRDQNYWRNRLAPLRKELEHAREKESAAKDRCEQVRSLHVTKPKKTRDLTVTDPSARPAECDHLTAIQAKRQEIEVRLENLQMEARHQGVPWSWLED